MKWEGRGQRLRPKWWTSNLLRVDIVPPPKISSNWKFERWRTHPIWYRRVLNPVLQYNGDSRSESIILAAGVYIASSDTSLATSPTKAQTVSITIPSVIQVLQGSVILSAHCFVYGYRGEVATACTIRNTCCMVVTITREHSK